MAGDNSPHPDNVDLEPTPKRNSTDPPSLQDEIVASGPAIVESPSMSRSSSKASSIDGGKPSKPKRPTNYAERKSSISHRGSISSQIKTLSLTPLASNSPTSIVPSTPISAISQNMSPASTTYTPLTARPTRPPDRHSLSPVEIDSEPEIEPYFPIPPPTRPENDVPRSSSVQMYWHQPPMHGMMRTGPARRSHSIAQIGSQFFLIGGTDGKPPKATNTVYIFDAGISPLKTHK